MTTNNGIQAKINFNESTRTVHVRILKFDSIRQETYWVTKVLKQFKTVNAAQSFAKRMELEYQTRYTKI